MAYSKEQIEDIFERICALIESGRPTLKAVKEIGISGETFYKWMNASEDKSNRYARAKSNSIELKFESIEDDYMANPERDTETGKIDPAWVQLQRLKIDAKKWELSKLKPKKYGDKLDIDHTSKGEKLIFTPIDLDVKKNDSTDEDIAP